MTTGTNGATAAPAQSVEAAPKGRFEGKVALVTGASDRGIGGAIAERLAREGASVSLLSLQEPSRLIKCLQRLEQPARWRACDVTKLDDVQSGVADCLATFGKLDILVNNAGVEFAKPLAEFTEDEWRDLLDVNLNGAIRMTRACLSHLTSPGGVIVNVASALALGGCPSFSIYSASKAGLVGFSQSLAWELAPRRVRVNCVAPGLVETPMTFRHIQHRTKEVQAQVDAVHPLGTGSPHDVASAVTFLASEDARWITGVTLPVGWAYNYLLPHGQFMSK